MIRKKIYTKGIWGMKYNPEKNQKRGMIYTSPEKYIYKGAMKPGKTTGDDTPEKKYI